MGARHGYSSRRHDCVYGDHAHDHHLAQVAAAPQTWDQGAEMAQHARLRIEAGVQVYCFDPHSLWPRGTNESTDGLLRQHLPEGTNLSAHSADESHCRGGLPQGGATQNSELASAR